ncbi:MAG: DNA mismatch repair protein MutS [Litoreibacter sp.]|nr:DNA mismatch repair protein MutS [Litoreibacter sp.]
MMAQFLEIKAQYKDALLFYRMGDFYEMFFDDAVAAAEALDIALTKRGKHLGKDIPMCGVPAHSAENYLLTLIRKGFRVAVCEQMENPAEAKKRGSKSVVRRDVVRLVTPGTLTEETLLEARRNNFLVAFSDVRGDAALAVVDISTGEFHVSPCSLVKLSPELARLAPSEVVVSESMFEEVEELVTEVGAALSPLSRASFDSSSAEKRLLDLFSVGSLDAFGQFSRAELSAMGAIVDYLEITQKGKLPLLRPPVREDTRSVMQIDAATRRNLELTRSLAGGRDGSLIATIDRTLTAAGGRLLERRISSPSTKIETISERLDAIYFFVEAQSAIQDVRDGLRKTPDLERAVSRLGLDRGGPRDLIAVRACLVQALIMQKMLSTFDLPNAMSKALSDLGGHDELLSLLEVSLVAEPPLLARDGGFVAEGFNSDLDAARALRDDGRKIIADLQNEYASQTDIPSLKIKHNNVLGYFIEATATHSKKMLSEPFSATFIHRQTTANAVRFTTVELSSLETRILNSGSQAIEIEKQIFAMLRGEILEKSAELIALAAVMAELDLASSLADLALSENWCRPVIDDSRHFEIQNGRHPVVEHALKSQNAGPFIENSCDLSVEANVARICLLTGPNMAGKSTYLRQNAIIALLAQLGSYVPASHAHIGLVSQLFSRVGASDDLARGRSTFMVEMVETAAILNQADTRALVILDEIGRGTATYDGLSIAWATLEHLHDVNCCRGLFATHYHELTALSGKLAGVENATVAVKEWEGDVIFLHEVRKGAADRSYGVQVAKLAGLPNAVVERARVVLDALEKGEREGAVNPKALIDDLPLFSMAPSQRAPVPRASELETRMEDILPDELTPREALQILYDLKALTRGS